VTVAVSVAVSAMRASRAGIVVAAGTARNRAAGRRTAAG
jgi:hypothetical protein